MVGKSWEWHYTRERPIEKTSREEIRACRVDKQERGVVPAGTFDTLKIVCTDPRTREVMYEMWIAPEVRQWVKERSKLEEGFRDRELLRYRLDETVARVEAVIDTNAGRPRIVYRRDLTELPLGIKLER